MQGAISFANLLLQAVLMDDLYITVFILSSLWLPLSVHAFYKHELDPQGAKLEERVSVKEVKDSFSTERSEVSHKFL